LKTFSRNLRKKGTFTMKLRTFKMGNKLVTMEITTDMWLEPTRRPEP